jgi:hypothetical protein
MSMGPIPPVPVPPADKRRRKPEVALLHLTDWQYGKRTTNFNREVARARVLEFMTKARRITEIQRADHPIDDCVIAFGGDMLEGVCWNFPTQPHEIDGTLFEQKFGAARLMIEVVRLALATFRYVTVVSEYGNHGRMGSKRDALPRADNLDRFAYQYSADMLGDEKRLTWRDGPEDIQRIEIGAYRAILIHGDEVGRAGFASPSTMVQHVAKWQSGAYPWTFRDALVGHYHNHAEFSLPNGKGSVYYTGSIESENRYARDTMAAAAIPSQRLMFIDPEEGRVTSVWKVWLT